MEGVPPGGEVETVVGGVDAEHRGVGGTSLAWFICLGDGKGLLTACLGL